MNDPAPTPPPAGDRSGPEDWVVVLYNDDVHGFEEVVGQIRAATGKERAAAWRVMLAAHHDGKSEVARGDLDGCQRVAAVLRRIGLQVEVDELENATAAD